MADSLTFRHATVADIDELIEFGGGISKAIKADHIAPIDQPAVKEMFTKMIAGGEFFGVLESDGKIVGSMICFVTPYWWNQSVKFGQQLRLWIDQKHRKMGGSKLLLDAAEEWAKTRGLFALCVGCDGVAMSKVASKVFFARGYRRSNLFFTKEL